MHNFLKLASFGAFQKGLSFVSAIIIGRYVGAADYGLFSLARVIVETISTLIRGGMDLAVTRELAIRPGNKKHQGALVISSVKQSIVASLIIGILVLVANDFWPANNNDTFDTLLFLAVLSMPFLMFSQLCLAIGAGLSSPVIPSFVDAVFQPTMRLVLFFIILAWLPGGLAISSAATFAYVLSAIFCAVWLVSQTRKLEPNKNEITHTNDAPPEKSFRKASLSLGLNYFLSALLQKTDFIVISCFASAATIGSYSMGLAVISTATVLTMPQNRITAPKISELWVRNEKRQIADILSRQISGMFFLVLPTSTALALSIPFVFGILGGGFNIDTIAIAVISMSLGLSAALNATGFALTMTGNENIEKKTTLIGIPINILSSSAGFYIGGMLGLAVFSFISNLALSLMRVYIASAVLENKITFRALIPALIVVAVCAAVAVYALGINDSVWVAVITPALFFVTAIILQYRLVLSRVQRSELKEYILILLKKSK